MASAKVGLVSYDYNSDHSSKYDPSSDEENQNSYKILHQPEIDDDETPADWAEKENDCRSLTAQEISHRLSNQVSIFNKIMPYKSIKCVFFRFAANTMTSSNNC